MFNNVVLDVFIGLIFVFLLYSLLATVLQEIIASRFGLRGRMLQKALRRMLNDGDKESKLAIVNWFYGLRQDIIHFFNPLNQPGSLLNKFYDHPSIKYLGEGGLFKKPAYLHGHNFSQTVIQLLRGKDFDGSADNESALVKAALNANIVNINPQTLEHLRNLFADARQDSYLFKHKLEDWFEETMERTTGWYKKQTQIILIVIGFVLAISFNVDALVITKTLMKDKKVREQMVQLAMSRQNDYGQIADSVKTITVKQEIIQGDTVTTIDSVVKGRPSDNYLDSVRNNLQQDARDVQNLLGLKVKDSSRPAGLRIFGWLITALAVSLGAPFWFDLLNKFVKLRESGPKAGNMAAMDQPASNNSNAIKDSSNSEIKG